VKLFRYIAKEIMVSMLAVSIVLLAIVMSGRFVKYLADAAAGDLAPEVLFSVMAYRLPGFLELVLPLGLFIGILLAYGRLYVESEMVVMLSCGLSTKRLAVYTLIPSIFVAAFVGYLTLYAGPVGIAKVQGIFQNAKNASGLETLASGRFRVDESTGRVIYSENISADHQEMQGVFSAQEYIRDDGATELNVIYARKGRVALSEDKESNYLVLDSGYQYIGQPGSREFKVTHFERLGQKISERKKRSVKRKKTDARTTQELLASNSLEDKATLQWRISLIILVPIIALIAQAMSKTDPRKGRYVKMLPAFLMYILYLVLLNTAREAVEKGSLSITFGMIWVHLVFLVLALMLLFGGDAIRRMRGGNV
jgi:lipopolysaccharide export system permease protein